MAERSIGLQMVLIEAVDLVADVSAKRRYIGSIATTWWNSSGGSPARPAAGVVATLDLHLIPRRDVGVALHQVVTRLLAPRRVGAVIDAETAGAEADAHAVSG